MPTFRYQLAGTSSRDSGLTIEAPDRAAAIRSLIESGQSPVRIEEARGGRGARARSTSGGVKRGGLGSGGEMLVRELATAVNAGLPLVPALRTIARQGRSSSERAMLERLIDSVEHGRPLSEAMQDEGVPFNELIVGLVRAGEASGRLGEVLTQTARLLERDARLRSMLLGALLYPAIIGVAVTVAVVVVVTVIVPRVLSAVAGQLREMPMPTRIVQWVAWFVGSYWWVLVIGVVAGVCGARRMLADPSVRLRVDAGLLRLPVVGVAAREAAVARFTRTLATLIGAGLPVVASLRVTRDVLGNRALGAAIDEVCDRVAHGATIAEPLERTGWFPPLLVQIVSLGEQTGRLDETLEQAASAFEERTERSLRVLTTALPPLLIIVLAGVVGFVVLSILLPLIELQESIG